MEPVPDPLIATCSRCIDQRRFEMPATWASRSPSDSPAGAELGEFVHRSGQDRAVARRLVDLIGQANRMAVIGSFLLADAEVEDAVLDAARRGVHVYLLLASEARLGREPADGEFEQRVYAEHKDLLRRLAGHVLIRSAPHFHAKFVLVDPFDKPAGMLLTANLTREALARNEELAVELAPQEVREAAALSRWAMWEAAEHELIGGMDFRAASPLGCIPHPPQSPCIAATTSKATQLQDAAWVVIASADREISVASFGWAADHAVVEHLCERAREGLTVTVLARMRPRTMPALLALAEAGAKVLGLKWLHAKALWADSGKALVMSANLEPHGLDEGFELGVRLDGRRAAEVRTRLLEWAKGARFELLPRPMLGELHGEAKFWDGREFADVVVAEQADLDLGRIEAPSADNLTLAPQLPAVDGVANPAHELHCHWRVHAPALHRKAKAVLRPARRKGAKPEPYRPPAYKEPGGRVVVAIRSQADIAEARIVAREVDAAAIVVDRRKPVK